MNKPLPHDFLDIIQSDKKWILRTVILSVPHISPHRLPICTFDTKSEAEQAVQKLSVVMEAYHQKVSIHNPSKCPDSSDGRHKADLSTINHTDTDTEQSTFDITCEHCGCSGSFFLDNPEIHW